MPSVSNLNQIPILSVSEIESHLRRLRRKSCGPDGIPFWVLRDFASIISSPVTVLFNRSLRSCSVPKCFKRATISPIPKCARPSHPGDYRPISLLPILSKVLERIVLRKCIFPYVHQKLDAAQFAYQPTTGTGTTSALTLLYHRVISFLDAAPGAVRIMTVDFKKAYRTVQRSS